MLGALPAANREAGEDLPPGKGKVLGKCRGGGGGGWGQRGDSLGQQAGALLQPGKGSTTKPGDEVERPRPDFFREAVDTRFSVDGIRHTVRRTVSDLPGRTQ